MKKATKANRISIFSQPQSSQNVTIRNLKAEDLSKIADTFTFPWSNFEATLQQFMQQVIVGINQAFEKEGQILIVAHGGIHWAICCLMNVKHKWVIDNCVPVHFSYSEDKWKARKLA